MSSALTISTAAVTIADQYASANDAQVVGLFLHNRTENTRRKYTRDLTLFFAWLGSRSLKSVSLDDLQAWTDTLDGAPKSKRERIATVRSFFKFATQLGFLALNPAALLKSERVKDSLHERILTDDERLAIIAATKQGRDRILCQFLFESGARVSEVCDLRVRDLRFGSDGSCLVSIYRAKTNETTTQRYSSGSVMPAGLRVLVDGRSSDDFVFRSSGRPSRIVEAEERKAKAEAEERKAESTDVVLVKNNIDGRLDESAVWRIVKAAAKRANISKPVSPHWLRHACATHLVQRENNLHNVARWLGHNSIQTTMRYSHVVGDLDLSHHFAR
jgi:integrase/recombinase XerD